MSPAPPGWPPPPRALLAVCAGGAIGTALRAALGEVIPDGSWPWATFIANIAGAGLLGYVVVTHPRRRRLLGAGVCGALTTFATMQLEVLRMVDTHAFVRAAVYVVASLLAGTATALLGLRIGRRDGLH